MNHHFRERFKEQIAAAAVLGKLLKAQKLAKQAKERGNCANCGASKTTTKEFLPICAYCGTPR